MKKEYIQNLLERYHKGECTAEEQFLIEEWFNQQATNGTLDWTPEEAIQTKKLIKARIDQRISFTNNRWFPILRIAAVIALVIATSLYFKEDIYNQIDPVVYLEKNVPQGKKIEVTLSDGTRVTLNGNSKLKYPKVFNRKIREVFLLEGEAYFDVVHNEEKPFIVQSKKVSTQVLGTAFNVKAYNFLDYIQVTVTKGKVGVGSKLNNHGHVFLLPNQQLNIDTLTGVSSTTKIEANNVIAWQKGKLFFNNERFDNLCNALERKYNVQIVLDQAFLKAIRLTAGFEATDRLVDVLEILSTANNLSYKVNGQTVYFSKK